MEVPKYDQPPLDPLYGQLLQQSQQQDVAAIQTGIKMDTASLLARYGTRLAVASSAGGGAGTASAAGSPLLMRAGQG